jgi:hypothetical protein
MILNAVMDLKPLFNPKDGDSTSSVGFSTRIFWNLRSKAASLPLFFLSSSRW